MNETDSAGLESNNDSDDWKSWSPEFFLAVLLHELRTPIMVISGYAKILSNEEMKENHPQALESISKNIERLEKLCDDIAEYRNELASRDNT